MIRTRHECEDFFGLFRREALLGSSLHGTHSGSDRVLLAEMALRGPWTGVPEPLSLHRDHGGRYTRAVLLPGDRSRPALWLDTAVPTARAGRMFHLVVHRHYLRVVRKNTRPGRTRAARYAELLRGWFTDGHLPDVLRDLSKTTKGYGGGSAPPRPSCSALPPHHQAARPVRSTRRGDLKRAGKAPPRTGRQAACKGRPPGVRRRLCSTVSARDRPSDQTVAQPLPSQARTSTMARPSSMRIRL